MTPTLLWFLGTLALGALCIAAKRPAKRHRLPVIGTDPALTEALHSRLSSAPQDAPEDWLKTVRQRSAAYLRTQR